MILEVMAMLRSIRLSTTGMRLTPMEKNDKVQVLSFRLFNRKFSANLPDINNDQGKLS